jgi:hypothetical protein
VKQIKSKEMFLAKALSSPRKANYFGLKPGFKDFLCDLCGFARDAFDFGFQLKT